MSRKQRRRAGRRARGGDGPDLDAALIEAARHRNEGRLAEAEAVYRGVLRARPRDSAILHELGLIALDRGESARAADLIAKAVRGRDGDAVLHNNLGHALKALGRLDEAGASFGRAIGLRPDYAMAHNNLGTVLDAQGKPGAAEECYLRALGIDAGYVTAMANLGRALHRQGRLKEAREQTLRALSSRPGDASLHHDLGNELRELGAYEDAIGAYRQALALDGGNAAFHDGLGLVLHRSGRLDEAIECFRLALDHRPDFSGALKNLASALHAKGRSGEAIRHYLRVLDIDPHDASARHLLAALGGEATETAPREYVVELFDDYAERFDEHLASLEYRLPELLRQSVARVAGADAAGWRIMDLGCGTGICGPLFRDMADHMTGVDLSPRMIEKARGRGVYDVLLVADITEAMANAEAPVDLVLATDVFVYVGDLAAVFRACRGGLRAGGLFGFSTESHAGEGYFLGEYGRYAHARPYVDGLAEDNGFSVVSSEPVTVRRGPHPVTGDLYILRRDGDRG